MYVCVTRQRHRIVIKTWRPRTKGICVCVCWRREGWSHLSKGLPTPVTCRGWPPPGPPLVANSVNNRVCGLTFSDVYIILYVYFYTLGERVDNEYTIHIWSVLGKMFTVGGIIFFVIIFTCLSLRMYVFSFRY